VVNKDNKMSTTSEKMRNLPKKKFQIRDVYECMWCKRPAKVYNHQHYLQRHIVRCHPEEYRWYKLEMHMAPVNNSFNATFAEREYDCCSEDDVKYDDELL
jgi:5-methylcytosine-specific restriction endonuclease McrA